MSGQDAAALAVEPWDDECAPRALAWMPGVDEARIGTFQRWTTRTDSKGKNHPVALFKGDDGQLYSLWVFHVVLTKEMNRADPKVGDRIKVERLADRTSAKGKPYKMHRVTILDRAGPSTATTAEKDPPSPPNFALEGGPS